MCPFMCVMVGGSLPTWRFAAFISHLGVYMPDIPILCWVRSRNNAVNEKNCPCKFHVLYFACFLRKRKPLNIQYQLLSVP